MEQMTLFDIIRPRTLNDYWDAQRQNKPFRFEAWELQLEQERLTHPGWYFLIGTKCCGCWPMLQQTNHNFKPLCFAECLVCGRKTEPVDDYSWMETAKRWERMMGHGTDNNNRLPKVKNRASTSHGSDELDQLARKGSIHSGR